MLRDLFVASIIRQPADHVHVCLGRLHSQLVTEFLLDRYSGSTRTSTKTGCLPKQKHLNTPGETGSAKMCDIDARADGHAALVEAIPGAGVVPRLEVLI